MSDAPIRIGHADLGQDIGSTCDCCDGTTLSTLQAVENRPNLTAIDYRIGDHGRFKASMLANLASSAHPPLLGLGTREDDDFTIALIDAWASVCDVLSFYQERHANEAYIQTALERLSIAEIARLIGYRLHPGSAAETDLVFLMDDPPGAEADVADLEVPAGTRVQSQPGPDEEPQTFETLEAFHARVAWNRLRPRQNRRIAPANDDFETWLEGLPTLQKGDAIVIVGRQRGDPSAADYDPGSELWDFRRILQVTPYPDLNKTLVRWDQPLGSDTPPGLPAQADHRFFVMRERASLFGYNAPHPRVLSKEQRDTFGYTTDLLVIIIGDETPQNSPSKIVGSATNIGDWSFKFPGTGQISLDAVYKGFVEGGWVALTVPTGLVELYRIVEAKDDAEARYAVSGKTTRLTLDTTEGLSVFDDDYRRVSVYGASEEIALAEKPLIDPVTGNVIELDTAAAALPEGRRLVFAGHRAQMIVRADSLTLTSIEGASRVVSKGQRVALYGEPVAVPGSSSLLTWTLGEADGFAGAVNAPDSYFETIVADDTSEIIAETAILDRVNFVDATHSTLVLQDALSAAFDRRSLSIHANVAVGSHGESVSDILGGGDPSRPFQTAVLKQNPVTHLVAPTENGVASTLQLRIDGVQWDEVPNLYARQPTERVFTTSLSDAGETTVQFGDGISGARPPAGRDNIQAEYRQGLGRAGNLNAGQLSLPLDRPLGLREVTNPLPSSGGADAEAAAAARQNAPIYTLTLGRVVSVTDYRDFALGFPGIAKADARWVWQGETRRIVVTIAGDDGVEIPVDGPVFSALLDAYRTYGDPLVTFDLITYQPATFRLGLKVAVDGAYDDSTVLTEVEAALRDAFSFARRDFAQSVALSDVAARAHEVDGVMAVDIDRLYRDIDPQTNPTDHRLLVSQTGRRGIDGSLLPAEILTLSPEPFDLLEVMA
ncbi:baseplate J/gp47 family protein [Pelagibius sp. Alg239-R121]|uniref:baseplate J/gp47 family protein n=1 Tax=Pelagibius sp. Alg239-R121 TaxID=2993448 RepID=UPI0024A79CCC|nr:baseplate J/gp47 family protein [Pelagibius sp. Alg239-R121]